MKNNKFRKILKWFLYILFWPFSLSYWIIKKSKWSKKKKTAVLIAIWGFVLVGVLVDGLSEETSPNTEVAHAPQEISDQETQNEVVTEAPTDKAKMENQITVAPTNEPEPSARPTETQEDDYLDELYDGVERDNLRSDLDELEKMYADLQERYKLIKQNGGYQFDTLWISNWNRHLRDVKDRYKDYVFNKNNKYGIAKSRLQMITADLHTLYREYEADMQGQASNYQDFEQFIEESLVEAEENLAE